MIFPFLRDDSSDTEIVQVQPVEILDAGGVLFAATGQGYPKRRFVIQVLLRDGEIQDFRDWLDSMKGRVGEFDLPTQDPDMTLYAVPGPADTFIDIWDAGFLQFCYGKPGFDRIFLNNTIFSIVSAVGQAAGVTRITLDKAPGAVPLETRISYCPVARLDTDVIEIEHLTAGLARAGITVMTGV